MQPQHHVQLRLAKCIRLVSLVEQHTHRLVLQGWEQQQISMSRRVGVSGWLLLLLLPCLKLCLLYRLLSELNPELDTTWHIACIAKLQRVGVKAASRVPQSSMLTAARLLSSCATAL